MRSRDIVVVGASAGGVFALRTLVETLPADLGAAVMIVLHTHPDSDSLLADILQSASKLPVAGASDGEPFLKNHIYVSVPDRHLMIEQDHLRLSRGPRECHARPAVDVLFRSAAYHHGPRVIGVVLTGNLDDGTAGLWAIKDRGGIAVVQSPNEATYPSMPLSALRNVAVDHTVKLRAMAPLLKELIGVELPAREQRSMPDEKYQIENRIALEDNALEVGVRKLGPPTFYTCPECHGSLVAIEEGRIKRYRCHTGHAYSQRSLYTCGLEQIEQSLWSTLAHLEEEEVLLAEMAKEALDGGETDTAESHQKRIEVVKALIEELRGVALSPLFSDTEQSGA